MKTLGKIMKIIGLMLVVGVLTFAGITGYNYFNRVKPDAEGKYTFATGSLPIDKNYYVIRGEVTGAPAGIIRQETVQSGTFLGLGNLMYGSMSGDKTGGKVIIRFKVISYSGYPFENQDVKRIMANNKNNIEFFAKFVDTKANMVIPGDVIEMVCRYQYEAVMAVSDSDTLRSEGITGEFDGCKLKNSSVEVHNNK